MITNFPGDVPGAIAAGTASVVLSGHGGDRLPGVPPSPSTIKVSRGAAPARVQSMPDPDATMMRLASLAEAQMSKVRQSLSPLCKICGSASAPFDIVDFAKTCNADIYALGLSGIAVVFFRCDRCDFLFTTLFDDFSPEEMGSAIYNAAYSEVDPDFISRRPQTNAIFIESMLRPAKRETIGLDYGGGQGLTAQLMRNDGWRFDNLDPFGNTEMDQCNSGRYTVCTAFEVFEHLPDPVTSLSEIVALASPDRFMMIIGTHLSDSSVNNATRLSWWYAAPRNGHISLFSKKAMAWLAETCSLDYYNPRPTLHLLTRRHSRVELQKAMFQYVARRVLRKLGDR